MQPTDAPAPSLMNEANCPYCRTVQPVVYADRARRMARCADCNAWFVWPPPTHAAITAHYSANDRGMPRDLRQWREGTSQEGWYRQVARSIARRAGEGVRSIVDIGAGGLELSRALATEFPDAHLQAWDLFPDSLAAPTPRMTLRSVDLNRHDDDDPPVAFDVVACVAVLEHVLDPLALLRRVQALTAPGGLAFVIAPEAQSIAHRILGRNWPYYCPEEHLTLPTLVSIQRALALIDGDGTYVLERVTVGYSLQYVLRFLRLPIRVPAFADVLMPVPAGALELVWKRRGVRDQR